MVKPVAVTGLIVICVLSAAFWWLLIRPANALDPMLQEVAADLDRATTLEEVLRGVVGPGCQPEVLATTVQPTLRLVDAMDSANESRKTVLGKRKSAAGWLIAAPLPRFNPYRRKIRVAETELATLDSNLQSARALAALARGVCVRR